MSDVTYIHIVLCSEPAERGSATDQVIMEMASEYAVDAQRGIVIQLPCCSHLALSGNRDLVLAGIVAILDLTSIRVGNEEYVRADKPCGLTTLRTRRVTSKNGRFELRFRAKGVQQEVLIEDQRLVRLMRHLRRLPCAHVVQYLDDGGAIRRVDSLQVRFAPKTRCGRRLRRRWRAASQIGAVGDP